MRNNSLYIICAFIAVLLTSCGKYEDIKVMGVNDVKFSGLESSTLHLTATLDIENPNRANIKVKAMEFKTWLGNREFGTIKLDHKIKIKGNSRAGYEVPVEIKLRTAADALKFMTNKEKLLKQMTVEGYIKGGNFPITKKIVVKKQPVDELLKKFK